MLNPDVEKWIGENLDHRINLKSRTCAIFLRTTGQWIQNQIVSNYSNPSNDPDDEERLVRKVVGHILLMEAEEGMYISVFTAAEFWAIVPDQNIEQEFHHEDYFKQQEAGPYDVNPPAEADRSNTIQRLVRSTHEDNSAKKESTADFVTRILKPNQYELSSSVPSRHADIRQKSDAKSVYMSGGRGSAHVGDGGAIFSYYPTHLPHDTDTTPSNTHHPPTSSYRHITAGWGNVWE